MGVAEQSFEELVGSRYDALRRTAFVLCGDHGYAEDLVQNVLAKVYRSWPRVQGVDDLDAYLHTAVVNASRTWWRRRWHGERTTAGGADSTVDDATADVDLRMALVEALGRLGSAHREVLALRFLAGLSELETAARLGIARGTVKSRVSRALAELRANGALQDEVIS
ncbi:MAG: putative polymerase sigma factor [Frankiales bacterium]|nr:putative polymerase sigma factor [Frankiales bacterium]